MPPRTAVTNPANAPARGDRRASRGTRLATPATAPTPRGAQRLVWAAAIAGTLHAAFSLYWATGGTWLLDTVGDWAVDFAEQPLLALLGLGALGAAKLVAAWVPVLVASGRLGGQRVWRRVSWVGGSALIAYGGLNTVIALAVVSDLIDPEGGYDSAAMLGHAALWDPLFLVWGLALVGSLWRSRDAGTGTDRARR